MIKEWLTIRIGKSNLLLYLILPHYRKIPLLDEESTRRLDVINTSFNAAIYSGKTARDYDQLHAFAEGPRNEYPAKNLIAAVGKKRGFGTALEIGSGTGYFTAEIARYAEKVLALEPNPEFNAITADRCQQRGIKNVEIMQGSIFDLFDQLAASSVDCVFLVHTLHHLHRRPEVFRLIKKILRPGGRVIAIEPHHNSERVIRLFFKYLSTYRHEKHYRIENNWATHDCLSFGELKSLATIGGFAKVTICAYRIPVLRKLFKDFDAVLRLENFLGRIPLVRNLGRVVYFEAYKA